MGLGTESVRLTWRKDFDMADDPALWSMLVERTGLEGGGDAVRRLTHAEDLAAVGKAAAHRWIMDMSHGPRVTRQRWCPQCLAGDAEPYFRRTWHWTWLLHCPSHGTKLRDTCAQCSAAPDVERVDWKKPLVSCRSCGAPLACANDAAAGAPAFVAAQTGAALRALAEGGRRDPDFWTAVWCLQKWVLRVGPQHWATFHNALAPDGCEVPSTLPEDPAEADALAFATAWHLATTREDALPALTRRYQGAFSLAVHEYCPPSLQPMRVTHPPITARSVQRVVDDSIAGGKPLSTNSLTRRLHEQRVRAAVAAM